MLRFGENVKRLRERAGISQKTLARRLNFKDASNSNISTLERRSTVVPQADTVKRYAAALGCEPWELLAGVPTEYDWLRTPQTVTDAEMATLLLGLAYLSPDHRARVMALVHSFLDAPALRDVEPIQALLRELDPAEKVVRTHRGKKRA